MLNIHCRLSIRITEYLPNDIHYSRFKYVESALSSHSARDFTLRAFSTFSLPVPGSLKFQDSTEIE